MTDLATRLLRQSNDGHGWDKVPDMLRDAAAEIKRLHEVLIKYGRHKTYCDWLVHGNSMPTCTCGLFTALYGNG